MRLGPFVAFSIPVCLAVPHFCQHCLEWELVVVSVPWQVQDAELQFGWGPLGPLNLVAWPCPLHLPLSCTGAGRGGLCYLSQLRHSLPKGGEWPFQAHVSMQVRMQERMLVAWRATFQFESQGWKARTIPAAMLACLLACAGGLPDGSSAHRAQAAHQGELGGYAVV